MKTKPQLVKQANQLIDDAQEFVDTFNEDYDDEVIDLLEVLDYLAITGLKLVRITNEDVDKEGLSVTAYAYAKALEQTVQTVYTTPTKKGHLKLLK